MNWFSVAKAIRIGSMRCVPCICYAITAENRRTVMALIADGKAKGYAERVYFQSGKAISVKSETSVAKPAGGKKVKSIVVRKTKA